MSKRLLTVLLAIGLGSGLGSLPSASAYCDPAVSAVTGRCDNACTVAARAYVQATGRPAPWVCPA